MRFPYYRSLSADDRRTYRKSDSLTSVLVPDVAELHPVVATLEKALASGQRPAVQRASQRLVTGIVRALDVEPVRVKVLAKRPKNHSGELHGLYTVDEDDRAQIEVWMRTAEQRRVVAFRTFLRTLLHEVCHHLDLTLFELEETFHTEGFFRRESSLVRQLAPEKKKPEPAASGEPARAKAPKAEPDGPRQLSLFR